MCEQLSFVQLRYFYERHLLEHVMPFWLKHCIDREFGGILNCVSDSGEVVSTEKYLWSQCRALWTFSALYNHVSKEAEWLEVARQLKNFVTRYGRDDQGRWVFCVDRRGGVSKPAQSIYVDAFAIYGLTEYARATGDADAIDLAVETFELTSPVIDDHANLPTEPHPIPAGFVTHGPPMIFSHVYYELGLYTGRQDILDRAVELAETVMTRHLRPEHRLLYEFLNPAGEIVDSDIGGTFLPGHAIESMWFMLHIYCHLGRPERINQAIDAIRWHVEKGWDREYGGLYLACHAGGGKPIWHSPDSKVWWPHTEALYALLLAFKLSGQPWCLEWYQSMHEYTFRTFPCHEHGEWVQNFDRQGRAIGAVIKNFRVKDPFHLPRALIYARNVLGGLAEKLPDQYTADEAAAAYGMRS